MSDYKWTLKHRCKDEDELRSILNECGFTKARNEDNIYKRSIRDWKTMEIRIVGARELEVVAHWMGDTTTETYFDYLMHCGMRIGMVLTHLKISLEDNPDLRLPLEDEEPKQLEEASAEEGKDSENGGSDE
jgi:hypothetical protein